MSIIGTAEPLGSIWQQMRSPRCGSPMLRVYARFLFGLPEQRRIRGIVPS